MGDANQLLLLQRQRDLVLPPVLEVGSNHYGTVPDFRPLFAGARWVGADMQPGEGVDVVVDLTDDFARVDGQLAGERFRTIVCFSVLEHCRNPFRMCEALSRLTLDGGTVFVSVPFSWQIHAYPSDYWRFTPAGVSELFPAFAFDPARCSISTSTTGEIKPIDGFMYRAELSVSAALRRREYGLARSLLVRLVRRLKLFPFIFDYRYLHPPVMVNMVGRKRAGAATGTAS